MKLFTEVEIDNCGISFSLSDKIMLLGSCFADNIGQKMKDAGFNVCINPFGTLYNPASILSAVNRLNNGEYFRKEDCVEMGAGAGLICSFSHHTSFARPTVEEFLTNANIQLKEASEFWKECNKVIFTLGTSYVWERIDSAQIVSNCLKRPSKEFTHRMLSFQETLSILQTLSITGKESLFTVSPIRHLSKGAHANTLSKANLHLALNQVLENASKNGAQASYFPAFEILCDELRDYRYYAEDLVHPSPSAITYLWEKFISSLVSPSEHQAIRSNEKASAQKRHRSLW